MSDRVNTCTWDARNQLIAINDASVTASFTDDAVERRRIPLVNRTSVLLLYDRLNGSTRCKRSGLEDEQLARRAA